MQPRSLLPLMLLPFPHNSLNNLRQPLHLLLDRQFREIDTASHIYGHTHFTGKYPRRACGMIYTGRCGIERCADCIFGVCALEEAGE